MVMSHYNYNWDNLRITEGYVVDFIIGSLICSQHPDYCLIDFDVAHTIQ